MPRLDPDRWRAVSRCLDEVLELPDHERPSWMAALREQDPALADEVRVLLQEDEIVRREGFLEQHYAPRPGVHVDDGPFRGAAGSALAGRTVGAYKLVSPIGEGGMGVVWLAERCDGNFEGRAAVKLLDIRFGRSEVRFRREADILARLAHPNIAHLIDAGLSPEGQPYLVLELVDGQPIDRYCDDRALDVPSRIRLFLDVLEAVAHAHANRIVHRDIKPSNVLVRTDGHAKLLDFGIAKLQRDGQPSMASTLTLEQGAPLTPAYAAPEQVTGGSVTTATDIYALGVLLYVLLTGQHPFGEISSPADLVKAIVDLETKPPSAAVVAGSVPEHDRAAFAVSRATTPDGLHKLLKGDLDTIVGKALKKDPLDRYASVAELAEDLRRHLGSEPIHARRDRLVRRAARFVRRHPVVTATGTIGILAVGGAAGFYALRPAAEERSRAAVAEPAAPAPVTSEPGDEKMPSLSPDGTHLAFSWVPPNASNARIVVRPIGTAGMTQLTDGSADDATPVWSPDGQHIAFVRGFREPGHTRQICVVPVTGGPIRVLHTSGYSPMGLAWWEAGNALLFSMSVTASKAFRLAAVDLAALDVRLLTGRSPSPEIASLGDFLPAVAPDGRTVAFVRETREGRDVYLLDLGTGTERRLTRDHHRITGLTWSADGQAVIMSSSRTGADGLYRVSIADGAIVRVPNTGEGATQPMAGRGGLVFSQVQADSNIYRADLDARTRGQGRLIIASSRADLAPDISPDGLSIAFLSTRGGGHDIWIASADGSNPRRLTSLPVTSGPRWSPDGRAIAFGAQAPGMVRPEIFIVDTSGGGTPTRVSNDPAYETILGWAADGASVYVRSDRGGGFDVWNMPVQGGPATQVTHGDGLRAQESADGQFLYYSNDVPEVWRRPLLAGSPEELVTTFSKGTHWGGEWVVGARGLYYLNEQVPGSLGIDFLPFGSDSRRPVRVAPLLAPAARHSSLFALAPDESWLVWAQEDYRNTDIMMVAQR